MESGLSMQKDNGYYRYQHKKHALRHKNITRFVYKIENYFADFNKYDSFKIHCSCPMCSEKTNNKNRSGARGWEPSKNWSIADKRKLENMKDQVEELIP